LQAKLTLHAVGASPHAVMSSLDGTVFAVLQDGAVRGLNVAQMIRSLTPPRCRDGRRASSRPPI